jgi:hypothetical protein
MPNTAIDLSPTAAIPVEQVFFDTIKEEILAFIDPLTNLSAQMGSTKEQLAASWPKCNVVVLAVDDAYKRQEARHITPVTETTEEYFDEMLNVLPPCQWYRSAAFSHFYVSERIIGNIVLYLVKKGSQHFTFQDQAGLSTAEVCTRIDTAQLALAGA